MTRTKMFSIESLSGLSLSKLKWFYPFEPSGNISQVKKPVRFEVGLEVSSDGSRQTCRLCLLQY